MGLVYKRIHICDIVQVQTTGKDTDATARGDFARTFLQLAARINAEVTERLDQTPGKVALGMLDWLAIAARAQDEPICAPDQPCIAPAVTAIPTPTATPVVSPSPEATPVLDRPFPLTPCKLSPGCVYMPVVMR